MSSKHQKHVSESIAGQVKRSSRHVTILFTDIEESTKLWDKHGDVTGRLMADRHNRPLFPIVRKFCGRVIKTIGDAIVASFRNPRNGTKAAIAMQQIFVEDLEDRTAISSWYFQPPHYFALLLVHLKFDDWFALLSCRQGNGCKRFLSP